MLQNTYTLGCFARLVIDDCFLFVAIVIRLLLCDGDSLGWFFLVAIVVRLLLCNCNLLGWFFLVAIVDSPCDSDLLVIRHFVGMLSFCDCASRRPRVVLSRFYFAPQFLFACPSG